MRTADGVVHDRHHCRCHKVATYSIQKLRDRMMTRLGFEEVLEEDHGQVFGRRLLLSKREQLHIKVMSDGWIEAEIEPPPEYPLAHINQKHSYSAHHAVIDMLGKCGIRFRTVHDVPPTCLDPIVDRPSKPTHWKVLLGASVAGVAAFFSVLAVNKLRS